MKSNMERKEIKIDAGIIKRIILSFILAFITVFVVEHFSSFSYVADTSNLPNYTPDGKIIVSQEYNLSTTKIAVLTQKTPFGTEINIPPNGMMSSELHFSGTEFKSYSNKVQIYFKAIFKDLKYVLMIWGVFILVLLFFKKYKLKVTK